MQSVPKAHPPRRSALRRDAPRSFRNEESGTTVVIAALTAPLLLALAGLGGEGAYAYFKHASMQSVSDVAALSAAAAYKTTANVLAAKAEAASVAAQLGYRNSDNLTVTVNSPPLSGPNTTNLTAVEVILTLQQEPLLTRVFRNDAYTIRTRSVSRPGAGTPGCILTLSPTASPAITVNGTSAATLTNCSVYANSNASNTIGTSGGGSLVASDIYAVGSIESTGGIIGNKHPGSPAQPDPYASIPAVTVNCPVTPLPNSITGPATIQPGVYCNGLKLRSGAITLAPGTYIVAGGAFSVAAQAVVNATAGVTIVAAMYNGYYFASSVAGGATFNLTAPTTGPYAGVAYYADRNMPADFPVTHGFSGQAGMTITGAIYAPTSDVAFAGGSSGASGCTQIVSLTLKLTGGSAINSNCTGKGTKTIGPVTTSALVD